MRILYAIVGLVAGCAVEGRPETRPTIDEDMDGELGDEPVHRLVPDICDRRAWPDVAVAAKDLDIAGVAMADGGAAVVGVARSGGAVLGFRVDERGDRFGEVAVLRDDRVYTEVALGVAADRLVLAAVAGDKIALDIVRDDLGARHALGDVEGTLVVDVPVVTVRDARVAVVGGEAGVTAAGFSGGMWDPIAPVQVTKSAIVAMTATPYLDDALIAWSTDTKECHLQRFASRKESVRSFACDFARIAIDPARGRGALVYEQAGDVVRTEIRAGGESELANQLRVAELASSPRVVFDGERTWIAYLNAHGEVVVGFLDAADNLVSRAIGARPLRDAYELVVFGGGVWVVAVDDGGFGAQRMCVR